MDVFELQSLLNGLGLVTSLSGMDLSYIVEHLCNCSLNDDEIGVAEWSRLLTWLVATAPTPLN